MKGPAFWIALVLAGVAVFLASFLLRPYDVAVGEALLGAPGFVLVAGGLAFLGGVSFVAPAVIIGGVALAYFGRWWGAARLVGATGSAEVVSRTLKLVFERPRPEYMLVEAGGYSFPSGHATMGAAVAVLLLWFAGRYLQGRLLVTLALVVALGWAAAMAASRLVLGVHYFSDVVGGIGVGTACASAAMLVVTVAQERFSLRGNPAASSGRAPP